MLHDNPAKLMYLGVVLFTTKDTKDTKELVLPSCP